MPLTPEQQAAAWAPGSVAVTAGAGTGKTHLLAERYLFHLTEQGHSPLAVVAVTFTEKAAAELRQRIRQQVYERLPGRPDCLMELETAQISTLHALAARICRDHPEQADVPPDFAILADSLSTLWLDRQVERVVGNLAAQYCDRISYGQLRPALQALLRDPYTAQQALAVSPTTWPAQIAAIQQQALAEFLTEPTWQAARALLQGVEGQAEDRLELSRREALEAIAALETGRPAAPALTTLAKLKTLGGWAKNWPVGQIGPVRDALNDLRDAARNAQKTGLVALEMGPWDEVLIGMLPTLKDAFHDALTALQHLKHEARVLDYADLELGALRALAHPEVQAYYHDRWQAYLVDEFQDTNPAQAELLAQLVGPAVLTIVGDEKQSIYSFRRADVSVFLRYRETIAEEGGQICPLQTSFRTHGPLVQVINQVFAPVLGDLHQDLLAHRSEAPNAGPHIQVFTLQGKRLEKDARQRQEAQFVARRFQAMLDQGFIVHPKGCDPRPVQPGDMAILARTWDGLEVYGEALEALGIPVVLGGGTDLLSTRPAQDGWALVRWLLDPTDTLALVAVLRSPWLAVSDRVLFSFAQTLPKGADWWRHLRDTDMPELRPAQAFLADLAAGRYGAVPSQLLQAADRQRGYTAVLANLPDGERRLADWQGFLTLLRTLEAQSPDPFTVGRQVQQLIRSRQEVARPVLVGQDAVSLMTIHSAKGLEWPVLAVVDLNRPLPPNFSPLLMDSQLGVGLRLVDDQGETQRPAVYTLLDQQQQRRQRAEACRVYYVALTRVRDHLLLTANDAKGGGLDLLMPGLKAAQIPIQAIPPRPDLTLDVALPPLLPEPPACLVGPVGPGLLELPATSLTAYLKCPRQFKFQYLDGLRFDPPHPDPLAQTGISPEGDLLPARAAFGTLVHRILELDLQDEAAILPLTPDHPDWATKALDLANHFRRDEHTQSLWSQRQAQEVPIAGEFESLWLHGSIDLLGPDFVLDFKTDQRVDPQEHRLQLWAYAHLSQRPAAHLAYLKHQHLHTFIAADLEIAHAEARNLIHQMHRGAFEPTPNPEHCLHCAYREICPAAAQG